LRFRLAGGAGRDRLITTFALPSTAADTFFFAAARVSCAVAAAATAADYKAAAVGRTAVAIAGTTG
jgi:Ca2+-binding RTX toxin-like protein